MYEWCTIIIIIDCSLYRKSRDIALMKIVFLHFKEREIQYGSIRAPEVSESGFPVALHRGNITDQVIINFLTMNLLHTNWSLKFS